MARTGSLLAGVLLGAAAGVVLGVLFAPEEGKETQNILKNGLILSKSMQ